MKDRHTYEDRASYIDHNVQWELKLDGQNVLVNCDDESRTYTIPEPVTDFKVEDEYVFIYVEGGKYYQFKFEFDRFFVGDIFDTDGNHLDDFACHTFGEDN
jgi:hypothetical protein